jgi:hypothetical protein
MALHFPRASSRPCPTAKASYGTYTLAMKKRKQSSFDEEADP